MTYIPNVRNKYKDEIVSKIPDEPNPYYEGNVKTEGNLEFIRGYDWCAENVVDAFFDNLDAYFGDDSVVTDLFEKELPERCKDKYLPPSSFADEDPELREVETYGDLIRQCLLDWIEEDRNVLVTSIIDDESL